jgi:hypothetical protein
MDRKIYDILNVAVTAKKNCDNDHTYNPEWRDKWGELVEYLEKNYLPHGSGFDSGTHVVEDECVSGTKLVLSFDYHHMDEHGYYDGWTSHKVIVTPFFDGIGVKITGALPRKYRHSKDYFCSTMVYHLTSYIPQGRIDKILNVKRPA